MKKEKTYPRVRFDATAFAALDAAIPNPRKGKKDYVLNITKGKEKWEFDTLPEFLASVDTSDHSYFVVDTREIRAKLSNWRDDADADVSAASRAEIESVFSTIEKHAERCRLPEPEPEQPAKDTESHARTVFIGHGQSQQWRDLKDHLHEKHGYEVEHYEMGSRAGHTIRDILEDMMAHSSVALLVMTGEDETSDGALNPRLNVVHEAGLFQGRLGFTRAIILLEEGATEFSNIHGLQQIRFAKAKIRETFGDVLAFLKRELG